MKKQINITENENGGWSLDTNIKDSETLLDGLTIVIMAICKSKNLSVNNAINEVNSRMAIYEDLEINTTPKNN